MTLQITKNRTGKVRCFVGEGDFDLQLSVGDLISLQELTGVGPAVLMRRLQKGEWMMADITETVRLGLIGGGMNAEAAFKLVQRSIRSGYVIDFLETALTVVIAALVGVAEDEAEDESGEAKPLPTKTTETPTQTD